MNKTLGKSIEESIKKNLPAQVADQLKERLEELESTENRHKKLLVAFKKQTDELAELKSKDRSYDSLIEDREQLGRETSSHLLEVTKFDIEKQLYNLKVEEADKRATLANNLVSLLVKNPEAITMVTTDSLRGNIYYDNQGVEHSHSTGSISTIQTTNNK